MKTTIAAFAAGLLLASAPAFAAGDANRINSGARAPAQTTPAQTTQGADAGVNANDPNATRTARNAAQRDNSWSQTQNQSAGEATPAAPDPSVNPQPDSGRSGNTTTPVPAQ